MSGNDRGSGSGRGNWQGNRWGSGYSQTANSNYGRRGFGFGLPNKGQDQPAYGQGQHNQQSESHGLLDTQQPPTAQQSEYEISGLQGNQSYGYDDSYHSVQADFHSSSTSLNNSKSSTEQNNSTFKTPDKCPGNVQTGNQGYNPQNLGSSPDWCVPASPAMGHSTPYQNYQPKGVMIGRGRGAHEFCTGPPGGRAEDARSRQDLRGNGGRDRSSSRDRKGHHSRSPSTEKRRDHSGSRSNKQWSDSSGYGEDSFSPYRYGRRRDDDPLVFLSRTLSSILRHNAEKFGFKLMKGGFLYVDEILRWTHKLRGFRIEDVVQVVHSNDKQRFTLEEEHGRLKIRANQGHTLEVDDLDLQPITSADDFPRVIHGTYFEAWEKIKESGLNKMKRNHIHFAPGEPGQNGVISGMRSSCQVMIYLDLEKALKDGLKFFLSSNNVILSPGDKDGVIHPRYFQGAKTREGYRLDFDPNVGTKPSGQGRDKEGGGKRKNEKKGKKNKEGKDRAQAGSFSTDDSSGPPSKVQVLDKPSTSAEPSPSSVSVKDKSKHTQTCSGPEDTGVLKRLEEDYGQDEEQDDRILDAEADNPDAEIVKSTSSDKGEETIEVVDIHDPDVSRCTIDDVIKSEPSFVVIICCGENLGMENSCIKQLAVGCNLSLFVFNLEDKAVMTEGQLNTLLLHKDIAKVFCRISDVSLSLINEYDILMNGVPIWDLEVLYDELPGQMSGADQEQLRNLDFQKERFDEWAKNSQKSGVDSHNELKQQAVMMYKLFELFQKSIKGPVVKNLKKIIYDKGIPTDDSHFLYEKLQALKIEQKEREKKEKSESNQGQSNQTGKGGKSSGKGSGAGAASKKKNKRK